MRVTAFRSSRLITKMQAATVTVAMCAVRGASRFWKVAARYCKDSASLFPASSVGYVQRSKGHVVSTACLLRKPELLWSGNREPVEAPSA
jgi:hypothetical protein